MIIGIDEAKQDHNKLLSYGHQLAESVNYTLYEDAKTGDKRTMEEILEGLPHDSIVRSHTAIMLENTRKYFSDMSETTKLLNIGDFEKYAFPMVNNRPLN